MMRISALMHAIKGALDQMIVLVGWRSEQRALGIVSHERLWRLIGVAARARPLATSRKSFFLELGRVRASGGHGLLAVESADGSWMPCTDLARRGGSAFEAPLNRRLARTSRWPGARAARPSSPGQEIPLLH